MQQLTRAQGSRWGARRTALLCTLPVSGSEAAQTRALTAATSGAFPQGRVVGRSPIATPI